jgi:hypothetical protein
MAVFLIPLFLLYVLAALNVLSRDAPGSGPRGAALLLAGLCTLNAAHMALCANVSYYSICPYDAKTRMAVERIVALHDAAPEPERRTLAVDWLVAPSVCFYKIQKRLDWLTVVNIKNLRRPVDYFYLVAPGSKAFRDFQLAGELRVLRGRDLRVVQWFPLSGTVLAAAGDHARKGTAPGGLSPDLSTPVRDPVKP